MAILERDRFDKTVVAIDGNRNATAVKEKIAMAESEGRYVCKPQEREDALRMSDGVLENENAAKLLRGGIAESSVRWTDPETGVLMRCRPDFLRVGDGVVVDLKTYSKLDQHSMEEQIYRMKYHWQSAIYLAGVNAALGTKSKMFAHVFIDTKAFIPRVVVLDDQSLQKAEDELRPLIRAYAEHLKTDTWPGYPDEILTVGLPSYAW